MGKNMKRICIYITVALVVRNPRANARDIRDAGWISGSERSHGGGSGNLLRYSYLRNLGQRSLVGYSGVTNESD